MQRGCRPFETPLSKVTKLSGFDRFDGFDGFDGTHSPTHGKKTVAKLRARWKLGTRLNVETRRQKGYHWTPLSELYNISKIVFFLARHFG